MRDTDKIVAFLATADAPMARAFYEGMLDLTFVQEDNFAIVYEVQGVELRIQKLAHIDPQSQTALGWSVNSIEETVRRLTDKGVVFERYDSLEQDRLGVWQSPPGAKIAWFKDPDANILSLTEHLKS